MGNPRVHSAISDSSVLVAWQLLELVAVDEKPKVIYCPECGEMFEYDMGVFRMINPLLRFCTMKCLDTYMKDKE